MKLIPLDALVKIYNEFYKKTINLHKELIKKLESVNTEINELQTTKKVIEQNVKSNLNTNRDGLNTINNNLEILQRI